MRTVRRNQAGFSLLEALIAAVVLGVGLVGLARLHITSIQGTMKSDDTSRAAEVARGMADRFATIPLADIPPACGNRTLAPTWVPNGSGCAAVDGVTTQFSAEPPCVAWYREDSVPDINQGGWIGAPLQGPFLGDGSPRDTGNFRVDLRVSAHPRPADFPHSPTNNDDEPVGVIWVWVCYRDASGIVHEVSASRVVTAGL